MKAILYVGGALMVAASIYGFIDYKKSSHDKNFNRLYNNKEVRKVNDELNSTKQETVKVANAKEEVVAASEETKNKEVKSSSTTEKKPVIKKKRKVTFEKFSRAKLDDKFLEEKVKIEPKKEEIKVEKKDQ